MKGPKLRILELKNNAKLTQSEPSFLSTLESKNAIKKYAHNATIVPVEWPLSKSRKADG
jgi:hypothetical protein